MLFVIPAIKSTMAVIVNLTCLRGRKHYYVDIRHKLLFLDFETFYSDEYSLRNLPIPNYILDPRFEVTLCAVREDNGKPYAVDGPDFAAFIGQFDPARTTTVTYNALFDNSILAWRYGFVPNRMLDAMGMARALRGHLLPGASLDVVTRVLDLGQKGKTLLKVKGMNRQQIIAAGLWPEYTAYALQDVELCAKIFLHLYPEFPAEERRFMDLVLRCAVQPTFIADTKLFTEHLAAVRAAKATLLTESGVGVADLMSTTRFKEMLEDLGVEIQYKTTSTGRTAPAFAKTDAFMEELSFHEDPQVQALAAARLGHKSTIEETRTQKLLSIGSLPWPAGYGTLPMPMRYGAAHTHRLGGDWGMNVQNLPTARSSKGKSRLRQGLLAPPGHKVVTADLGQIEARLVAWLCGARALLKQFADNLDPYAKLAEAIFGYPVDRKKQILEGFIGKTGILGLGYACGADRFYNMVILMARAAGLDLGKMWTPALAQKAVDAYRAKNFQIPVGWRTMDRAVSTAWLGKSGPFQFGPGGCITISRGRVTAPDGFALSYANPRYEVERDEYWFDYGRHSHKIYGAKMLENIVQFLARQIIRNVALRVADHGFRFVLQAHDELVFIVRDEEVDKAKKIIHMEMTRSPSWAPDLPLKADVNSGQSYGEAK